jgi:hypothetical protein
MKTCDNCYWRYYQPDVKICGYHTDKPIENTCDNHSIGCKHCAINKNGQLIHKEIVKWQYRGEQYCDECMADAFGIERREYTGVQYFDVHGDFIGDSFEMDLEDIFLKNSRIEYLGEE